MKTKVVQILIRRNLTSEPSAVVLAHEIPVLRVIRGVGAITILDNDCKDMELKAADVQPRAELIRLKQRYSGFISDGQHPVDIAFPDGSRDLELFYEDPSIFDKVGEDEDEGGGIIGDDVLQDNLESATPEKPVDPIDPADAVTPVFSETGIDLTNHEAVVAELTRMEVPFIPTMPTENLAALLTQSLEPGASG